MVNINDLMNDIELANFLTWASQIPFLRQLDKLELDSLRQHYNYWQQAQKSDGIDKKQKVLIAYKELIEYLNFLGEKYLNDLNQNRHSK